MNTAQLARMHEGQGFVAALDQSGGSTPKALELYGIEKNQYHNDEEMFDLVHAMRTRVLTSRAFTADHILGVILFENTMLRTVEGEPTPDYLWQKKGIVPFLKIDQGLEEAADGVQLMKAMPKLGELLRRAVEKRIFGTKMRSVIQQANREGIARVVEQQFEFADRICQAGLVPIIEPEVSVTSADKAESEKMLLEEVTKRLEARDADARVMFKFSLPSVDNFYAGLMRNPRVVRIVALSGGYARKEAVMRLARNKGMIASFSRALLEGLSAKQTDAQFNAVLAESIQEIYRASTDKPDAAAKK